MKTKWVLFLVAAFIVSACMLVFMEDRVDTSDRIYDLQRDGVFVIKNVFNATDVDYLKKKCVEKDYSEVKPAVGNSPHFLNESPFQPIRQNCQPRIQIEILG